MLSLFQMFSFKSMLNTLPSIGSRASSIIRIGECKNFPTFAELHTSPGVEASNAGSIWRLPRYTGKPAAAWPNYIEHYTHRRHRIGQVWHTWGVQKQTKMNVVDNSAVGRKAMAEGRPPYVIQVYTRKHTKRPHSGYGKLGDRVMVAIMGQKKKGIIVGLKAKQRPGIPRFDSNNIVLVEENGNPSGNRITAPLPNCIRPILQRDSNPKKADYTKLFAIATKWV